MRFYKRFPGDYAGDTGDLSLAEHGAYTVLLDHYYANDGSLPTSLDPLYRLCRAANGTERKAVASVADRFFAINGDGRRHNKRADVEIAGAHAYADAQAMRAHMRWHKSGNASHSHSPEEAKAKEPIGSLSEPAVPDCPHEQILALYAKHLPMLTQPRLWDGRRAELLRTRWRSCAKRNAVWPGYGTVDGGLAFWDQFFSDVSKCRPLTHGIDRGDGSSWKPDLPWLLKAENFAKVIEGKYHR